METELSLGDKLPVTWALRTAIEEAPRGQVPDLAAEFDERGAEGDNAMARARDELMDSVSDAVTRSFRPAFGIAAALAALAGLPGPLRRPRNRPARARRHDVGSSRRSASAHSGSSGWPCSAPRCAAGARDVGEYVAEDPCTADPDPFPGGGLDGTVQRIALSALNGAACELGTTPRTPGAVDRPGQRLRRRHVG